MSIVWKPIPDFESYGEVSNTGLIRNAFGVLRKTNVSRTGYERVGFAGRKTVTVHALVAKAFCDGYEAGLQVNHKDGDKLNNTAENLEWVTASENIKHAFANGLKVHARHNMIIQDEDLPNLLERRVAGETYKSIADDYGVDYRTMFKRLKDYNGGLVQCR